MRSSVRGWVRRCVTAARPGFGSSGNSLRRRSDRIQAAFALAAVVVVLAVLPVAILGGLRIWGHFSSQSHRETASRHLVHATVRAAPADASPVGSRLGTMSWTYPARVVHEGRIAATSATRPGDRVAIWVDDAGAMTAAPITMFSVWFDALGFALGLLLATAAVALLGYRGGRLLLNRHRSRELEAEWRRFTEIRSTRQ